MPARPASLSMLPGIPAALEVVPAWVRGESAQRAMVILRAGGCAWDRRRQGGCAHCGFRPLTSDGARPSAAELLGQVESALSRLDCAGSRIFEVDLYNSGNFLNESEIPAEAQSAMAARVAREEAVRVLLVESRPEYISAESLDRVMTAITRRRRLALEVGIGLESASDAVRERYLRKGVSRRAFERSIRRLGDAGADLLVYVMLKAMPMSEEEALRDVVRTGEYTHDVAGRCGVRARIALQPTYVAPGTRLAEDYQAGRYAPPSLPMVVEAVRRLAALGELSVGLWDEGLRPLAVPEASGGCRKCLIRALQEFNRTQEVERLGMADCRGGGDCPVTDGAAEGAPPIVSP
jgi:radical SAM enzyme (TIGR01210 family)